MSASRLASLAEPAALSRRAWLRAAGAAGATLAAGSAFAPRTARADALAPPVRAAVDKGLAWLVRQQSRLGHWNYPSYGSVPATAMSGMALICSGSTTMQGPYAESIRRGVDYILTKVRENGLIGDPRDARYTYGHGYSMLFLSQVLGEEEDLDRREELIRVLTKAVEFCIYAQTRSGGWGYVSAKDGRDFDEGSTTITQVQGLRACRNAGIPVSRDSIEQAKQYIYKCKNADGGISYSSKNRGSSRPAITAAALACLYNAGDYDSTHVPEMAEYCKKNLGRISDSVQAFGHWHYTYLYYAQVMYRQDPAEWEPFRDKLFEKLLKEQAADGSWSGEISPVYTTSCDLIILQLDNAYLPIYQR